MILANATNKNEAVEIIMDETALGIMGEPGDRTCVRPTADHRFAVHSAAPRGDGSYRLIKVFTEALPARQYNAAIHGERL